MASSITLEGIRGQSRNLIPGRDILRVDTPFLAVAPVNRNIFDLELEDPQGQAIKLFLSPDDPCPCGHRTGSFGRYPIPLRATPSLLHLSMESDHLLFN